MLTVIAHVLVALSLSPGATVWPLEPRPEVVEVFAPPASEWAAGHRGVDLLGSPEQPVRAAQGGTITFAGLLAGRGVVVVSHGETRTTYQPVAATVDVGDVVLTGQEIGVLRSFGSHCWPRTCLHWGLLEGDTYLNPLALLGAGPVRLLPLYSDLPAMEGIGPKGISPKGIGVLAMHRDLPAPFIGSELMSTASNTATTWSSLTMPGGAPGGRPAAVGLW